MTQIKPVLMITTTDGEVKKFEDFTQIHYSYNVGGTRAVDIVNIIDLGMRPSQFVRSIINLPAAQCDIYRQSWKLKLECRG